MSSVIVMVVVGGGVGVVFGVVDILDRSGVVGLNEGGVGSVVVELDGNVVDVEIFGLPGIGGSKKHVCIKILSPSGLFHLWSL
jgi:hypothetical protein